MKFFIALDIESFALSGFVKAFSVMLSSNTVVMKCSLNFGLICMKEICEINVLKGGSDESGANIC